MRPLVVFPETNGPLKSAVRDDLGLPVFELPYSLSIPVFGRPSTAEIKKQEIKSFVEFYKELELDAVVVNTSVLFPAAVAAALTNLPLILHSHGVINQVLLPGLDAPQWHQIESVQLHLADRIIVPSTWIARYYSTFFQLTADQLTVLPNGTPLPCLDDPACARVAEGPPQFSMLCTLEPNKGVETVLEAASIVLSRRPKSASLVVYGDGASAYREKLQFLIQQKGLQGSFLLRPKQGDVSSIYRNSCAVIVASHIESFSFVAIEAMSHSRPVIATRCGGPEEIIEDGQTGFLIEIGDAPALAERILRLIEDHELCEKMGRAGRAAAEARFDIRTIGEKYLATILAAAEVPRTKEWMNRRRLLATLLMEVIGPRQPDDSETAKPYRLSQTDLSDRLELLRLRFQEINLELSASAGISDAKY